MLQRVHIDGTGQAFVVVPQVTVPVGLPQVPSLAEQVVVPVQLTVPPFRHFAVHVAFCQIRGSLATKVMASCWESLSEAVVGGPRIAVRASSVRGARLGVWAKQMEEMKRTAQASNRAFLMRVSLW